MKNLNSDNENSSNRLIPNGENKCVWMNAGVVAFKLCDLNFDCENCPFDKALRTSFLEKKAVHPMNTIERKGVNSESILEMMDDYTPFHIGIKKNVFYHSKFTWVEPIHSHTLRMGIDPFLLQLLNHVHVIVLPLINTRIHQGEYFCWLFGEYPPLPIVAPISGTVNSVNTKIRLEPEILITSGDEPVWLAEIETLDFNKEKKTMIYGEEAIQWRNKHVHDLKKQFISVIHQDFQKIGATLQDGGIQVKNLSDVIGKTKYYDIIFRYLRKST